jgi:hypothetical protein
MKKLYFFPPRETFQLTILDFLHNNIQIEHLTLQILSLKMKNILQELYLPNLKTFHFEGVFDVEILKSFLIRHQNTLKNVRLFSFLYEKVQDLLEFIIYETKIEHVYISDTDSTAYYHLPSVAKNEKLSKKTNLKWLIMKDMIIEKRDKFKLKNIDEFDQEYYWDLVI